MAGSHSLYTDILFHFTTKDSLWGILSGTFSVSYSKEKIVGKRKSIELHIPMVSFCDLKISELKSHMEKYGNYGIGLKKEWANTKGLNPVFYVNKSSPFTGSFIRAVGDLRKYTDNVEGIISKAMAGGTYMDVFNVYRYMKNYEGNLVRRSGKVTKNYRFADEREWRYVPSLDEKVIPFLPGGDDWNIEDLEVLMGTTKPRNLHFQPDDIKYLIVENENDISSMISHLKSAKSRFDRNTIERLVSRILTVDQINNDV